MPNKDGGHYFLTTLIPILRGAEFEPSGDVFAPTTRLREILALMPIRGASGSAAGKLLAGNAPTEGFRSPFSCNLRNHFVRFAVIDDVNFNGRPRSNVFEDLARGVDPINPEKVDHLSRPYLLFTAELDNPPDGPAEPGSYLRLLWRTMEADLKTIFAYCYGFEKVTDAASFAAYIESCQVETTMPFNDYWTTSPPIPTIPYWPVLGLMGFVGLAVFFLADLAARPLGWGWGLAAGIIAGLIVAVLIGLAAVRWWSDRPFPTSPHSDLPAVLKALYLQRVFVDFAVRSQSLNPDQLHAAFGAFLDTHRPWESTPTQPPGVVGA